MMAGKSAHGAYDTSDANVKLNVHQAVRATDRVARVAEPTKEDIDALVGLATPHFAMQIRARRVRRPGPRPPRGPSSRRHGDEQIALLERLAFASSKAEEDRSSRRPGSAGTSSRATRRPLIRSCSKA